MNKESPSAALNRLADSLEKLASAIEADAEHEKTASDSVTDYGTLAQNAPSGADALTKFLLGG